MAPPNCSDGSSLTERMGRVSQEELLQHCKRMLTEITDGLTATVAAGTTTAIGSSPCYIDDGSGNSRRPMGGGDEYNLLETTMQLFEVLSEKDKRNHTETVAALKNRDNNRDYGTNRKRLRADDGPASTKEAREDLLVGTTAMEAAASASSSVTAVSRSHDTGSRSTTGGNEDNRDSTTRQLDAILSANQQRNHTAILDATTNSTNHNEETEDGGISARSTNRTRLRADDDPATKKSAMKRTLQFPASIIINHVLPYLDHDTWKSVSILSTGIHGTIQKMQLFPPWPTMRGITVEFNKHGVQEDPEERKFNNFTFSFDHTDGSRLVAWDRCMYLGLIFDSKRGLIKEIDCDMIMKREKDDYAEIDGMYLLDRKTLLVIFNSNGSHSLYLYRLVEDNSSPRNAVGFDMVRHSTITKLGGPLGGPWIFKRNGVIYVAVTQGWIRSDKVEDRAIVIYQYLGETTWPGCLIETHRLQYPEIEFDDDDEDADADWETVFEFIGQPRKDTAHSSTDERIVFVSVTNTGNLYVHCWCVTFEDQTFGPGMGIGTGINNGNYTGEKVPCISLGTTPDPQLRFLNYKKHEDVCLKIVPWPNKDKQNYVFRIIQGRIYGGVPCPFTYRDPIDTGNMENIFLFDYNMITHKFDNTNNLLLTNRDQSVLQYDTVFAAHDGRHLFTRAGKDHDYGVYRIDTVGCSLVANFKSITGEIIPCYDSERLSNNNKMLASPFQGDESAPGRIHIKYLYFN